MGDILGVDFLTNPKITETSDIRLPDLTTVELPSFHETETIEPPKLVPSFHDAGPVETNDGFRNMNVNTFSSSSHHRMSDEHLMKEKYEILRKFDRLSKLGVPMRKRFTLDSPLEEMKMELEFIRREKAMDQTIKQFCDWYITGMSAMEWSSKNVPLMQAFGLKLDGLSESAQMNVADMEEDFEELYDLYGDKLKMHPLVRIPIRTCMMVYMVHLTNQMAMKSPIPNMDQILKSNPDIARQLSMAAMQQQTQGMRAPPPPPVNNNPLAGLTSFMSGMIPPPPQQTNVRPPAPKVPNVKFPKPNPQPPAATVNTQAPAKEMRAPVNIDELLKSVNGSIETKSVKTLPSAMKKPGGSTGKNSVTIKL
jgi:enamine deaminase RidA (YjgF/YER057c/UK114 family)